MKKLCGRTEGPRSSSALAVGSVPGGMIRAERLVIEWLHSQCQRRTQVSLRTTVLVSAWTESPEPDETLEASECHGGVRVTLDQHDITACGSLALRTQFFSVGVRLEQAQQRVPNWSQLTPDDGSDVTNGELRVGSNSDGAGPGAPRRRLRARTGEQASELDGRFWRSVPPTRNVLPSCGRTGRGLIGGRVRAVGHCVGTVDDGGTGLRVAQAAGVYPVGAPPEGKGNVAVRFAAQLRCRGKGAGIEATKRVVHLHRPRSRNRSSLVP